MGGITAFFRKHHAIVFYSAWFLLGVFQAAYTELQDDEAYYWMFSRFLDWGYFDHPPMTALLIKIGYAFFHNELGIRILMVALNTATLLIAEKLTERKDALLFYAICLSLAILQLAGFMAVPDIPLLFFAALFFLCYKHFVVRPTLLRTFLLSLVITCLLYSKYHAVLIILFTLLSYPGLLKRGQTYAAALFAFILFLPHLWWQYRHDWISFRYHLFESNINPYKLSYTAEYILGQLLITGPLAGCIFLYALCRYRTNSLTEKALQFTGIGMFVFFLISSFKGRVEANWTAPAVIPIMVLGHQYLQRHQSLRRGVYRLLPPTLVLVIAARVLMIADIIPAEAVQERFHRWKNWPKELKQRTQNLPVVFYSSYQDASKYWFYTGQLTYSLNEYKKRRNNFNFWPVEEAILGKPVYIINPDIAYRPEDSLQTPVGTLRYHYDSSFHSFAKIAIEPEQNSFALPEGKMLRLTVKILVPPYYRLYLQQHPETDAPVKLGIFQQQNWIKDLPISLSLQQLYRLRQYTLPIRPGLKKGVYFMRFAVGSDAGWFTHNSDKIKLTIQ